MRRGITGHFETTTIVGEAVRAFVPAPLPPILAIDLSGERQLTLEKAQLACGRLDGIAEFLPDRDLFLYSYVRREAVLSSQIEGTQSSLSDLMLFEMDEEPGVPFDDVVEVSNYVSALGVGRQRMSEGLPISARLLRDIHRELLSRGRGADKQPGEFRRSQNWIGGTRPGNAQFVPPPPSRVTECMAQLEQFIHGGEPLPVLVKAALAHVQFETIHPFLDGNGRVGRLLIVLMLMDGNVLRQPLLYLSLFFKQHRDEYYRLLGSIRSVGDWEEWIDFFLEGVTATASSAVDSAHRLRAIFAEDELLVSVGERGSGTIKIFRAFRERPLSSIQAAAKRAGVSFPTASKAVRALVRMKILRETTGALRGQVFAYARYLDVLNEGGEPIRD